MKQIALSGKVSQDLFIFVDDEDYPSLLKYKWYLRSGYAYRREQYYTKDNKRCTRGYAMHRELLNAPDGVLVDHKNFNRLDNQRNNLRLVTKSQNSQNRLISIKNTSGYKGVTFCKSRNKWQACLKIDGKPKYLGRFINKDDAAIAYNDAALSYFGEFACLNQVKT